MKWLIGMHNESDEWESHRLVADDDAPWAGWDWCFGIRQSSQSIHDGTRKMTNYACTGRSHEKSWWRLVSVLTCKSFDWYAYRGERL